MKSGGDSIETRREVPSDADAIRALVTAAFPTPAEAELVDAIRAAGETVLSIVAVRAGALVGHALLSKMAGPFPSVGLGPVSVLPGHQKRGIGSRLISSALTEARAEGWMAAFVLGAPAYYERFGFSVARARGFASPYAGPHFMVAPLAGELPTRSGTVDYATAFAALG